MKIEAAKRGMNMGAMALRALKTGWEYIWKSLDLDETRFLVKKFGRVPLEAEALARMRLDRQTLAEHGTLGLNLTSIDNAVADLEKQLGLTQKQREKE